MNHFLILGEASDLHAHYVHWAIETAGYQATFINASHDSSPTRTTLYLDAEVDQFTSSDWNGAAAAWCRRLPGAAVADRSGGEDEAFIRLQESRFASWLIEMQESTTPVRWINRPTPSNAAENKFTQLKGARAHGLRVPRTLITAEADRFRAFLQTEGAIVAKPLAGYLWEYDSGEALTTFANIIDAKCGSELSDGDIEKCITIYQQRIEKVADIRMVIMGGDVFAYRIIQLGEQHFDFRVGFFRNDELKYEEISIPESLKKKIIGFMTSMEINFASADFALTPDGEFVFLDLNPNGQWLFIEHSSPETRIGQKFCAFFVTDCIDPDMESVFPSYSEYTESGAIRLMYEAMQQQLGVVGSPGNWWKEKAAISAV
jgi:hypothetical protein